MNDFRCDFQVLRDAFAFEGLYYYVVCHIFEYARNTLNDGSTVTFYEDYGPDIIDPDEIVFSKLDDFNKWVGEKFPGLNC